MLRKLVALCLLLLLSASLTSGCWNRRDPENLAIVLAMGFDYDEERGRYHVIAQVANPLTMEEGGGQGGETRAFWTVSAFGRTPFRAMKNLTAGSTRELFWAHNRVLLFTEKLARRGIREVLDLFERERQLRVIARPVVVEGDLRKLMEAEFPLEETGGRGLDRQIITTRFERSNFPVKFVNELYSTIPAPGRETVIGRIKVLEQAVEQQEEQDQEQTDEQDNGGQDEREGGGNPKGTPPPANIGGGAIFRGDRMVGWATESEVTGLLYATGRDFRSSFAVECPVEDGEYLTIEVYRTWKNMLPAGNIAGPRIELVMIAEARIQDLSPRVDLDMESEYTRSLERRVAQAVRNDIEAMLSKSQELGADVFGFGNLFYRKRPQLWRDIEDRWDEIFPELPVDIKVNVNLKRTGLVTDPM